MKIAVFITRRDNEVVTSILTGIMRRAKENQIDVFAFFCDAGMNLHNPNTIGEYEIFGLPLLTDYDGIIIVAQQILLPKIIKPIFKLVEKAKIPAVCIEEEGKNIKAVGSNIYQGMSLITEHLIKVHHAQTFCYIAGYDSYENSEQYRAINDVLSNHGIVLENAMIIRKKNNYHEGMLAAQKLYDTFGKDKLPDAIICNNDEIAMGVIDFFEYKTDDVKVPNDIIVTGFYHTLVGTHHFCTPTTIECKKEQNAYDACDVLLKQINGETIQSVYRDTELVLGCSCGCKQVDKEESFKFYKKTYHYFKEGEYFLGSIKEMSEVLVGSKSRSEFMEYLKKYVVLTQVDAFYLMIEDITVHVDRRKKIDLFHAFDYVIDVPLIWKEREFTSYEGLETRKLLPHYEKSNGDLYLVYPIHYQEKAKGYCILKNPWHMLYNDYIVPFIRTLNTSLEICNQKTRLIKMNEQLNRLYVRDSLTGLLNRFGYEKEAGSLFMQNNKEHKKSMVAFVDLDRLKYINDNFGHEFGDISILAITGIMKQVFPKDYVKVRFGGDEFIVFGECADENMAEGFLQKIEKEIEKSKERNIFPFEIGASIGYVLTKPSENRTLSEYVQEADQKMYVKKLQRKAARNQLHEKDDRL